MENSTDINNGMISVKDRDVMEKRLAFQKTIELHKKVQEMQPNAVFKSQMERDCSPTQSKMMISKKGSNEFEKSAYQTSQTMRTSTKPGTVAAFSTIQAGVEKHDRESISLFQGDQKQMYDTVTSTRQGQDPGYSMLLSEHMSKPAFNATQPRFDYLKDEVRRAEVPGPGSYARFKSSDEK